MLNRSVSTFLVLSLLFCNTRCFSQDLFGAKPTEKYAAFLLSKKEYNKAANEYERMLFLDSTQTIFYKNQLVICYYHLNNMNAIYGLDIKQFGNNESKLILKSLLENEKYYWASLALDSPSYSFSPEEKKFNTLVIHLFKKEFEDASLFNSTDFSDAQLKKHVTVMRPIANDLINYKVKSPALAAAMSAIIPGTGRLYTRDYADAAINFLFISVTALQAYRGFFNPDIGKWQGWVYGSLSASFYLGNIFGSWKAAKRYNNQYYDNKLYEARSYYFDHY